MAIGLGVFVLAVMIEERTQVALSGSVWLMVAAHVVITLPWVVRLCLASLANHDRAAEEAAASLGRPPGRRDLARDAAGNAGRHRGGRAVRLHHFVREP